MWTLLLTCRCSILWWNGERGQTLVSSASIAVCHVFKPASPVRCQAVSHLTIYGR